MTYSREARFTGTPEKLSKDMKEAVDSLLEARVKVRKVHEALRSIASDASGTAYTDNYNDPEVLRVSKLLYELDQQIGDGFNSIEKIDRDLKKKVKKAYTYDRTVKASDAIATGAELTSLMRKGQWPSDMFNKGSILTVTDGASLGGILKLKIKGQVMGGPYDFKIVQQKDDIFILESANDRFRRGLKVQLRSAQD